MLEVIISDFTETAHWLIGLPQTQEEFKTQMLNQALVVKEKGFRDKKYQESVYKVSMKFKTITTMIYPFCGTVGTYFTNNFKMVPILQY